MKAEIGADEVGVGDYFGGIVTCACYLNDELKNQIAHLDIKDSKKLTNSKIISLAKELIKIVPYAVKDIYPKEYNELFFKYKNAHVIKTFAHNFCLASLQQKFSNEDTVTILDAYASKENYEKYLKIINPEVIAKIDILETKAESHYESVAAASIIARYYFLKQIAVMSKKYNTSIPLGYNKEILTGVINKLKLKLGKKFEEEKINLIKLHFKF